MVSSIDLYIKRRTFYIDAYIKNMLVITITFFSSSLFSPCFSNQLTPIDSLPLTKNIFYQYCWFDAPHLMDWTWISVSKKQIGKSITYPNRYRRKPALTTKEFNTLGYMVKYAYTMGYRNRPSKINESIKVISTYDYSFNGDSLRIFEIVKPLDSSIKLNITSSYIFYKNYLTSKIIVDSLNGIRRYEIWRYNYDIGKLPVPMERVKYVTETLKGKLDTINIQGQLNTSYQVIDEKGGRVKVVKVQVRNSDKIFKNSNEHSGAICIYGQFTIEFSYSYKRRNNTWKLYDDNTCSGRQSKYNTQNYKIKND